MVYEGRGPRGRVVGEPRRILRDLSEDRVPERTRKGICPLWGGSSVPSERSRSREEVTGEEHWGPRFPQLGGVRMGI